MMVNDFIIDDLYAFTSEDNSLSPADYHKDTIIALQDLLDDFILSYHPLAYSYGDDRDEINGNSLNFEYEINNSQYIISFVRNNDTTEIIIISDDVEKQCSFEEFPDMIKSIPIGVSYIF